MKSSSRLFQLILLVSWCASVSQAKDLAALHYLNETKINPAELLAPPPLAGSPEEAQDLETVRRVFAAASEAEKRAAHAEKEFDAFNFAPVIGVFFTSNSLPQTAAFLARVHEDADVLTGAGKEFFRRPRPFTVDPSLANGKLEKSFGYPSGHSTESMTLGLVLTELFPEKQEAILAQARLMGWHRVQIARHYPTDIYAGRVLAQAIVREMKKSEAYQAAFAAAQKEIAAACAAAKN